MFKRFAANFALIFLFAFVQIGVSTHEISHFSDATQHSQQDKNTHSQCAQCISYAEVAGGLPVPSFTFLVDSARFTLIADHQLSFHSHHSNYYAARAPPQIA